jgi:hypothetical protein
MKKKTPLEGYVRKLNNRTLPNTNQFGAYLLNVLATHLSPTKILEESMTFIDNLCKSPNPLERRAAISALCVLSSGSHFVMQEDLGEYIPYVYYLLFILI